MKITSFTAQPDKFGIIAYFAFADADYAFGSMTLRRLMSDPASAHVMFPRSDHGNVYSSSSAARDRLCAMAVSRYNEETGAALRPSLNKPNRRSGPKPATDDYSAVRRVVRADVGEACERAGLG